VTGRDVQKCQLVGAGHIVNGGLFNGVAGIAEGDEVDSFDHASIFDVEAGDDA
jgi:hypothetical protein